MNRWNISPQAAQLHEDAVVCDMTLPFRTPGEPALRAQLPRRLLDAGFDFVSFTVATDDADSNGALQQLSESRRFFQAQAEICVLVDGVDDILRAKAAGKLAAGLHFQGTVPIGRDLGLIDTFYKLGIRHMLMAYNQKNFVADGCHELREGGLSRFGREVVTEMNRVGMLVDVAHTGYRSSMDVLEFSDRPVIVSHGNVWALHQHARCYRDDQIKAVAASGGVIGLTGLSIFIGDDSGALSSFVDQIDYVTQLVGPAHVGFGFDYVFDIATLSKLAATMAHKWPADGGYARSDIRQVEPQTVPQITQALLDRGYAADDVRNIIGGNWMRVMRAVWK